MRHDRLLELLALKGWRAAELARVTSVPKDQISKILRGRQPRDEVVGKLADAFHVGLDYLVGRDTRFDDRDVLRAVAHLSLEKYYREADVPYEERPPLDKIAEEHPKPPLTTDEWEQHHTSLRIARRSAGRKPVTARRVSRGSAASRPS